MPFCILRRSISSFLDFKEFTWFASLEDVHLIYVVCVFHLTGLYLQFIEAKHVSAYVDLLILCLYLVNVTPP